MFVHLFSLGYSFIVVCFTYDLPITYQEHDKCSCRLAPQQYHFDCNLYALEDSPNLLDFLTGVTEITHSFLSFFPFFFPLILFYFIFYLSNVPLCNLSGSQVYVIIYFLFSDFLIFQSVSESLTSSLSHSQYYSLKMPVLAYLGVESLF